MGGLRAVRNIRIVAGCDINPQRRKLFQKQWGINRVYADYKKMLSREHPDILCIATWTDSHAAIAEAAAAWGVRAVICEKPIALNTEQAARMVRICKSKGTHLMINHERRFEDKYRKVKDMVQKGALGEIRTITGHVLTNVPVKQKSFNINKTSLMHDGTHLIDIISYIAGSPVCVSGHINSGKKEVITARMWLKSGVNVFIEAGGLRNYFDFELDIQGTRGRVLIGNTVLKYFTTVRSRHYSGFYDLQEKPFPAYRKFNAFVQEVKEASDLVFGKRKIPESSGQDGALALKVIEGIFFSTRNKGRTIKIH